MRVHICCRNWQDDRVIPRFTRFLVQNLGWTVGRNCEPHADINYLLAYFEWQINRDFDRARQGDGKLVSYMTHLEAMTGAKVDLYNEAAKRADLRIAMNRMQLEHLSQYGKTVVLPLPLETDRFTIRERPSRARPVVGVSGYTYRSGRKGERLVGKLMNHRAGKSIELIASGRGWPCPTKRYRWEQMPGFYQSLDVFLCTSMVEGGPMTTLEALATGCPVVIPSGVGIHDQIPDVPGIYRYRRGSFTEMVRALEAALDNLGQHDRKKLRAAAAPHSVQAWVDGNRRLFEDWMYDKPKVGKLPDWKGRCGIYVVAFGGPARAIAKDCIKSAKRQMPDVPVALCSHAKLGPEDITVIRPDSDIGGRTAKLNVWDNAPKDWEYILYVDADTEFVADVTFFFELLRDGWEFVICKDAHLHDTMRHFERRYNKPEYGATINFLGTTESLQINGGVWAFRRNKRTQAFFKRWYDEWCKYKGRDQGALIRALYTDPLRVYWLCNEWNTLVTAKGHEYPPRIKGTAGIIHWVGKARRWEGQIQGAIDSSAAWQAVEAYERRYGKRGEKKGHAYDKRQKREKAGK